MLTATTTDEPEATAITLAPGLAVKLAGSLSNVSATGSYKDRDTFVFTTGANVNEIEVRQNWSGSVNDYDVDLRLYDAGVVPDVSSAATFTPMEEFQTFAVSPNTTYWLWTGLWGTSAGVNALPYDISICGKTYAP